MGLMVAAMASLHVGLDELDLENLMVEIMQMATMHFHIDHIDGSSRIQRALLSLAYAARVEIHSGQSRATRLSTSKLLLT